MKGAHFLQQRKVLAVACLDIFGQRVVVGTFSLLELFSSRFLLLLGASGSVEVVAFDNRIHLLLHLSDLRMCEVLQPEFEVLTKLVLNILCMPGKISRNVTIEDLVAR